MAPAGASPRLAPNTLEHLLGGRTALLPAVSCRHDLMKPRSSTTVDGRNRVEGTIELEHVDARLTEDADAASVGVLVDEVSDLVLGQAAGGGHAGQLEQRVTASTGTSASSASPLTSRYAATRSSMLAWRSALVGPRFDPLDADPS
jgi:hypothetical protein